MDIYDFTETLCHLTTVIEQYQSAKKAKEFCASNRSHVMPNDISITIEYVLDEKMDQYEKQIIELATELTPKKPEQ